MKTNTMCKQNLSNIDYMVVPEFFEKFKSKFKLKPNTIRIYVTFTGEIALLCRSSLRWREGERRALLRGKDQERRKSKNRENES